MSLMKTCFEKELMKFTEKEKLYVLLSPFLMRVVAEAAQMLVSNISFAPSRKIW